MKGSASSPARGALFQDRRDAPGRRGSADGRGASRLSGRRGAARGGRGARGWARGTPRWAPTRCSGRSVQASDDSDADVERAHGAGSSVSRSSWRMWIRSWFPHESRSAAAGLRSLLGIVSGFAGVSVLPDGGTERLSGAPPRGGGTGPRPGGSSLRSLPGAADGALPVASSLARSETSRWPGPGRS